MSLTTLKYGPLSWFSESKPVPLSPCRYQGIEGYSSDSCLTSALERVSGQRHAPNALTPGDWTPGTHWIEGWVGLRAGLETGASGKIHFLCWGSNPGRPVCGKRLY
jgi:hypothetical protein